MRIELAKILLQAPDVLLLDEPTNHLDIDSIQWLEQFLAASGSAVMLVSHDRAFLDRVTNRTIEIVLGSIHDYRVNYSTYVELRKERGSSSYGHTRTSRSRSKIPKNSSSASGTRQPNRTRCSPGSSSWRRSTALRWMR